MPIGPRFVGDTELAWPVGTFDGPAVRPDEVAPVGTQADWTLSGMASDHDFFSHALLLALGMPVDPVALYWAENTLPAREAPHWVQSPHVIFKGLVPPLDRTVFACPRQYSQGLFTFLDRLELNNVQENNTRWLSVHQRLPLVDWKMVQSLTSQPAEPPTVPVDLYGVENSTGAFLWNRPTDLLQSPLTITWNKAVPPPPRRPFQVRRPSTTSSK